MRTLSRLLLACSFLAVPRVGAPQALTPTERARVDSVFAAFDHTDRPGCALGIARGGALVYERGYGMADLQHALAIQPASIFHVASISKQFAAYSVALLAADGRLSLDDDVRTFIPELPDYGMRITVRQLIGHISGIRDQWQLLGWAGWRDDDLITEADVLHIVTHQRALNFAPGAEYLYSNTGYTFLAVIVKRVSGKTLRQFAEERIFAPLGMTRTHFHDDHTMIVPGRTSAYVPRDSGGWAISIPVFDTYGATSLFTTAADLLKWEANLQQPTVGTRALVDEAERSMVLNDGSPTNYGFGLTSGKYRGERVVGHSGADAGYRSWVERMPGRNVAVAVLCNAANASPNVVGRKVEDILLGASAPAEPVPVDTVPRAVSRDVLTRWVGAWMDTTTDVALVVRLTGDTLRLEDGTRLIPTSDSTVRRGGAFSELVMRGAAGAPRLFARPRGPRQAVYERMPAPTTGRASWQLYAGSYASEELDITWRLTATDSTLVVNHRKFVPDLPVLRPAFADGFTSNDYGLTARFTRDRQGKVDGFLLSGGRVRRVRFVRVP